MRPRGLRTPLVAAIIILTGLLLILSSTGPDPELEASNVVRRDGGVCLLLEKWGLFGWTAVGQIHTILESQQATWHPPGTELRCQDVPTQTYLIRLPIGGSDGVYRLCGLDGDGPCVEFRRVPFDPGEPGP